MNVQHPDLPLHARQLLELADEDIAATAVLINGARFTGVWSRMASTRALACDRLTNDGLDDSYTVVNPDYILTVAVSTNQNHRVQVKD
jgi:hypothetical protein